VINIEHLRVFLKAARCPELWQLGLRPLIGLTKASLLTRPVTTPSGTIVLVNCPPIGTLGFRRYLRGLKKLASGKTVPLVAHISVTDRCNYGCQRCSNLRRSSSDPEKGKILSLLDDLKQAGTASIAFTGGEPLLRDDLESLVESCLPEIPPMLFTTGERLDESRAKKLRSAGLVAAFVSLDHYIPEKHNAIRGRNDAFDTAVNAISMFLSAGIYTAAQAVVTSSLLENGVMDHFLSFCRSLGVNDVVLLEPVSVCGNNCDNGFDESTRQKLYELHRRSVVDNSLPKVTTVSFIESASFFGCQAGVTFLYVSAAGDVFPCDFAPISFGNVYETGLEAIIRRLAESFPTPSGQCLALEMNNHQDWIMPVPWQVMDKHINKANHRCSSPALMKWFLPPERIR
jgi:MoaA/NifB/PqqE/SkfB family radical SAM enzyme